MRRQPFTETAALSTFIIVPFQRSPFCLKTRLPWTGANPSCNLWHNFHQLHLNRLASIPCEKTHHIILLCYLVTLYFPFPLNNTCGKNQTHSTWIIIHFPSSPYSGLPQGWFKPAPTCPVTSETLSYSYVQSPLPPNGSQPLDCYLVWLKLSK